MSSIRAVLFDVGGVLTTPIAKAMSASARSAGIDLEALGPELWEMFVNQDAPDNPAHALERGEITFDEFVGAVGPIGPKVWSMMHPDSPHCMYNHIHRSEPMHSFVDAVKTSGHRIGIVSNVLNEWLGMWATYTEPIERFDTVVYSCVDGMRKPNDDIFVTALERLNLDASEALYLDDGPGMVSTARRLGMTAILVESHDDAIAEARRLLAI